MIRSIAAVFCTALAVTLLGATPLPAPPASIPGTTLVVYPFRVADGLDKNLGLAFSTKLVAALNAMGGVKVVAGDATTEPADYLHAAKVAGGDYYLIGHIAPPFNAAAAVIEQMVSARSGTVVWSQTAYIGSDQDVDDQAVVVKTALGSYVMRGYASIMAAPIRTAPPPTPAPVKKAPPGAPGAPRIGPNGLPELPNEAYGFSSRPTAPPKVYASASKPSRFVVLKITGDATAAVRAYAETALITALKRHGQTVAEGDPQTTEFPIVRGPSICKDTGASFLVFGAVSGKTTQGNIDNNYIGWTDAYFDPRVYDCSAEKVVQPAKPSHGGGNVWAKAVDAATNSAVTGYLLKVATVAKSS
jgi:hypothetical protein